MPSRHVCFGHAGRSPPELPTTGGSIGSSGTVESYHSLATEAFVNATNGSLPQGINQEKYHLDLKQCTEFPIDALSAVRVKLTEFCDSHIP